MVGAALVKDLDVKFANIWYLLKVLHHLQNAHEIRPENLSCRSKNVVYLISCKTCLKQYTGSSEEFRARCNNCSCVHRYHRKNMKVEQESFHVHFADVIHSGEGDWEVRLIDQSDSTEDLRKRESIWQHELDSNGTRTHNHLVRKQTLNHFGLVEWSFTN